MKKRAENESNHMPKVPKAKKASVNQDELVKPEAPLPTPEEIVAAQKQAIEEVTREKLILYASKIQMAFKGKWFTLTKFQMKFKIPKPDSAQILLALFNAAFLAIDNRDGVVKYKIDFTVDVQLEIVNKEMKYHEDQFTKLEQEKDRLIKLKYERQQEVKGIKDQAKTQAE